MTNKIKVWDAEVDLKPVHSGAENPTYWFFYDETWAYSYGPYDTRDECLVRFGEYRSWLNLSEQLRTARDEGEKKALQILVNTLSKFAPDLVEQLQKQRGDSADALSDFLSILRERK